MAQSSGVHFYPTRTKAALTIQRLIHQKNSSDQILISSKALETQEQREGFVTLDTLAKKGAWLGGIFGLIAGAASICIPGNNPLEVGGPFQVALRSSLESALIGALSGGLSGALLGWCFWWVGAIREFILARDKLNSAVEVAGKGFNQ